MSCFRTQYTIAILIENCKKVWYILADPVYTGTLTRGVDQQKKHYLQKIKLFTYIFKVYKCLSTIKMIKVCDMVHIRIHRYILIIIK